MSGARGVILLVYLAVMAGSEMSAYGCSVCFGNPESNLTKGVAWGIVSLLGVVILVLGGITAFFVYLMRRSASAPAAGVSEPLPRSAEKV